MSKAKRWDMDGRMMTVAEIAEALGMSENALRNQMYRRGILNPVVVAGMVRSGVIRRGKRGPSGVWLVDGEWVTEKQVAERFGKTYYAVHHWRASHRGADGKPATLAEAVAHYSGKLPCSGPGRAPTLHKVGGRYLTIAQAAREYGMTESRLWQIRYRRKCSLAQALKYAEAFDKRKAVLKILRILKGQSV